MMPLFSKFFPPHVLSYTSDRTVDFTLDVSSPALNREQRNFLQGQLNVDIPELWPIQQVHGDNIIVVDRHFDRAQNILPLADGVITNIPDFPLSVRTADCLPVFICDIKHNGIALVHAGWKGCRKNILKKTVQLMMQTLKTRPEHLKLILGPSIRSCCYEVGPEFADYFVHGFMCYNGQNFLELTDICRAQLSDIGIGEQQIFDSGICTCCDVRYFSFRREGKSAGRMISIMVINNKKE